MKLFRKKNENPPQQALTRTEALACFPQRTTGVCWEIMEDGDVLLEYPLALKPFFLSLAKRFNLGEEHPLTKKLQLDTTGSRVWTMLDGERDVKNIIKEVAVDTGLSLQEAELSVISFLRMLGKRGLVILNQ
jgi:hypothetical protein